MAGSSTRAGMTSKGWSCHPVALPRARRIAMPIDSGVKPMSDTSSASAPVTAPASCSTPASTGIPRQRGVDVAERLVGLEEEVSGHADFARAARPLLEVDRHELATGNLVLTTHASHNAAHRVRMPGASLRAATRALGPVRRALPRALEPRLLGHDVVGRALVEGEQAPLLGGVGVPLGGLVAQSAHGGCNNRPGRRHRARGGGGPPVGPADRAARAVARSAPALPPDADRDADPAVSRSGTSSSSPATPTASGSCAIRR